MLSIKRGEKKIWQAISLKETYLAKNASYSGGPKNLAPHILFRFMPGVRLSTLGIACVCVRKREREREFPFNVVYFIARMHTTETCSLSLSLWSKRLLHWSIRFLPQQSKWVLHWKAIWQGPRKFKSGAMERKTYYTFFPFPTERFFIPPYFEVFLL